MSTRFLRLGNIRTETETRSNISLISCSSVTGRTLCIQVRPEDKLEYESFFIDRKDVIQLYKSLGRFIKDLPLEEVD